jgi:hypothetical protein
MCGSDVLTKAKEVNVMSDEKTESQSEEAQAESTPFLDCMAQMMSTCCPEMKEWMAACASNMSQAFSGCCGTQSKTKTTKTS